LALSINIMEQFLIQFYLSQ